MTRDLDELYKLLGLQSSTSKDEIKKRSKQLESVWNPARFASQAEKDQAVKKLQEITDARNRLLDSLNKQGQNDSSPELQTRMSKSMEMIKQDFQTKPTSVSFRSEATQGKVDLPVHAVSKDIIEGAKSRSEDPPNPWLHEAPSGEGESELALQGATKSQDAPQTAWSAELLTGKAQGEGTGKAALLVEVSTHDIKPNGVNNHVTMLILLFVTTGFVVIYSHPVIDRKNTNAMVPAPKKRNLNISNASEPRHPTTPIASFPAYRKPVIAIQPLGETSDKYVDIVKAAIVNTFDALIIVRSPKKLPANAYYKDSHRYKADKLIAYLQQIDATSDRVIGLTTVDISARKGTHTDWGVLGMAEGSACIVSTFRMRPAAVSSEIFEQRLRNVVLNQLAHSLGLETCETEGCVLSDTRGTVLTVDSLEGFCDNCRKALKDGILKVPAESTN